VPGEATKRNGSRALHGGQLLARTVGQTPTRLIGTKPTTCKMAMNTTSPCSRLVTYPMIALTIGMKRGW
jgi:hypothetical protein